MREPALNPPLYSLFLLFQPPFPTIYPFSPTPTAVQAPKNGQEKTRLMGGFAPFGFGMGVWPLLVEVSLIPTVLKSISKTFL